MTEETSRVTMVWPASLKQAVRDKVGTRELTAFTVSAVEQRLKGGDLPEELTLELNQTKATVQLLADRLAMGGDTQDRREALMEVDLPTWVDTTGWPTEYAALVKPLSTPVEQPVETSAEKIQGSEVSADLQPDDTAPDPTVGDTPAADPATASPSADASSAAAGGEPAASGARDDLFARVMERTGGQLDPGFASLKTASELPPPLKPAHEVVLTPDDVAPDPVDAVESLDSLDAVDAVAASFKQATHDVLDRAQQIAVEERLDEIEVDF